MADFEVETFSPPEPVKPPPPKPITRVPTPTPTPPKDKPVPPLLQPIFEPTRAPTPIREKKPEPKVVDPPLLQPIFEPTRAPTPIRKKKPEPTVVDPPDTKKPEAGVPQPPAAAQPKPISRVTPVAVPAPTPSKPPEPPTPAKDVDVKRLAISMIPVAGTVLLWDEMSVSDRAVAVTVDALFVLAPFFSALRLGRLVPTTKAAQAEKATVSAVKDGLTGLKPKLSRGAEIQIEAAKAVERAEARLATVDKNIATIDRQRVDSVARAEAQNFAADRVKAERELAAARDTLRDAGGPHEPVFDPQAISRSADAQVRASKSYARAQAKLDIKDDGLAVALAQAERQLAKNGVVDNFTMADLRTLSNERRVLVKKLAAADDKLVDAVKAHEALIKNSTGESALRGTEAVVSDVRRAVNTVLDDSPLARSRLKAFDNDRIAVKALAADLGVPGRIGGAHRFEVVKGLANNADRMAVSYRELDSVAGVQRGVVKRRLERTEKLLDERLREGATAERLRPLQQEVSGLRAQLARNDVGQIEAGQRAMLALKEAKATFPSDRAAWTPSMKKVDESIKFIERSQTIDLNNLQALWEAPKGGLPTQPRGGGGTLAPPKSSIGVGGGPAAARDAGTGRFVAAVAAAVPSKSASDAPAPARAPRPSDVPDPARAPDPEPEDEPKPSPAPAPSDVPDPARAPDPERRTNRRSCRTPRRRTNRSLRLLLHRRSCRTPLGPLTPRRRRRAFATTDGRAGPRSGP